MASSSHNIVLTLTGDTWVSDLVTDQTKLIALVRAILNSNKQISDPGYEAAFEFHRDGTDWTTNVVRISNTVVNITVPAYAGYINPVEEKIQSGTIPRRCVDSNKEVTIAGETTVIVVKSAGAAPARFVTYSGTFYIGSYPLMGVAARTHQDMALHSSTIVATLTGDTWAPDIVTDITKRTALVAVVLHSDKNASASGFEKALASQWLNTDWSAQIIRNNATQLTITIPAWPSYDLPPEGHETVQGIPADANSIPGMKYNIPGSCLGNHTAYALRGSRVHRLVSLSATFLGRPHHPLFFDLDGKKLTSASIRHGANGTGYSIGITLSGDVWHEDIASNLTLRRLLLQAILHSDHSTTDQGYERNLEAQWLAQLSSVIIVRNSDKKLTITLPALPKYEIPSHCSADPTANCTNTGEHIMVKHIPPTLLQGSYAIYKFKGVHSAKVLSTTAVYSGTFFQEGGLNYWDRIAHSDEQTALASHEKFIVVIDLVGEEWHPLVNITLHSRRALLNGTFFSNQAQETPGFDTAWAAQLQNASIDMWQINRHNNTRVTIVIPKFPAYRLPAGAEEQIRAHPIAGSLTKLNLTLSNAHGTRSALIMARTATFSAIHGSQAFFRQSPLTDLQLRAGNNWTIVITLSVDRWQPDLQAWIAPANRSGVHLLLETVFGFNNSNSGTAALSPAPTPPALAFAFAQQIKKFQQTGFQVIRHNARRVALHVPPLPNYYLWLPFQQGETLSALPIPSILLAGHTDLGVRLGESAVNVTSTACAVEPPENGHMGNCSALLQHLNVCVPQCDRGFTLIGNAQMQYRCSYGVLSLAGACVPTYYLVGICQASNRSHYPISLAATSMSPFPGTIVSPNHTDISFFFNRPIQAGAGSIFFAPSSGGASISVSVEDPRVTILNSTLTVHLKEGLPASSPFTTYTALFDAGLVESTSSPALGQKITSNRSEACCATTFVTELSQCPGSQSEMYYGQVNLRDNFRVEFSVALHETSAQAVPIFSFGHVRFSQGAVLSVAQSAVGRYQTNTTLDITLYSHVTRNVAAPMSIGVESHWAIIGVHTRTGCFMTVEKDGLIILNQTTACPPARVPLPVLVGSSESFFTLRNLIVHASDFEFSVPDQASPVMIDHTPKAGTAELLPSMAISFTFSQRIRPGKGGIKLTPKSGPALFFDAHSAELDFEGNVVTLTPATPIPDTLTYDITIDPGALQSSGAWQRLLTDFAPVISVPLGCLNVSKGFTELSCYVRCRDKKSCVAFRAAVSGPSQGLCCLFSSFNLELTSTQKNFTHALDPSLHTVYSVYSSGGVYAALGDVFAQLNQSGYQKELGTAYGGLAGPDTKIKGLITMSGIAKADFFGNPKAESSFRLAIAKLISRTVEQPIAEQQVTISEGPAGNRRLLSSVMVFYTVTIPSEPGRMPEVNAVSAMALALQGIGGTNSTFLKQFKDEAQALGALTIALNTHLSAIGAIPTVTQAATTFQFSVSDKTGPLLIEYLPVQGAVDVTPATTIKLTFTEGKTLNPNLKPDSNCNSNPGPSAAVIAAVPTLALPEPEASLLRLALTGGIQAGSGDVLLAHEDGEVRHIAVTSTQVRCVGSVMYITPEMWLQEGRFTVSVMPGVILDDAHSGTGTPAPFAGIAEGTFIFTVKRPPMDQYPRHLSMSAGVSSKACLYAMVHPFFHCRDFAECTLFLTQTADQCEQDKCESERCEPGGGFGQPLNRRITWTAMQQIGNEGARRNNGDGRDVVLSYGGGIAWPEQVIGEFPRSS